MSYATKCFFCKVSVDHDDTFCHGCGFHVCDDCDTGQPIGQHEVGDHQLAEQEDDFEELDFNDED